MSVNTGSAKWSGGLKDGKGYVSTGSGALSDQPYGFNTRFEHAAGTNPEELIGAAHASCFSMALSMILGEHDLVADEIQTMADVTLEQTEDGFTVTKSHLSLAAKVPGASEAAFLEAANTAKENCPISKLLDCEITMQAELAS